MFAESLPSSTNAYKTQLTLFFSFRTYVIKSWKSFFDREWSTFKKSQSRVLCYWCFKVLLHYATTVVQTLDRAIHRINHYPADKYYGNQLRYPLDSDLSGG